MEPDGESFVAEAGRVRRTVRIGGRIVVDAAVPATASDADPKGCYWRHWLSGRPAAPVRVPRAVSPVRLVDLFAGCGGLSLGVESLLAEAGLRPLTELAADTDQRALDVYAANRAVNMTTAEPVERLVGFAVEGDERSAVFMSPPEIVDPEAARACAGADLVVAGPPCQGHSNLNNWSRRDDPRNSLFLAAPAFAVACGAAALIVENVPQVVHDKGRAVQTACALLRSAGYRVASGVLDAAEMGWPQRRKRHFLVARRAGAPCDLGAMASILSDDVRRSVGWGLLGAGDGIAAASLCPTMDKPSSLSDDNNARIAWLFDHDAYDLDLRQRPQCHRNGTSYKAVYGRMDPAQPAPTITTGFECPGKGRFVHPFERRTLTPREAARLQGFPSSYRFASSGRPPARTAAAKWIGNAVPVPLGYAAALSALGPGLNAVNS